MTQPIEAIERIILREFNKTRYEDEIGGVKVNPILLSAGSELSAQAIWDAIEFNKETLRDIIVKHTSEMLDNPDEYGIYPTTKFYNNLIETLAKEKVVKVEEGG